MTNQDNNATNAEPNAEELQRIAPWLRVQDKGLVLDLERLTPDMEPLTIDVGFGTFTACAQGVCIRNEGGMYWHWRDGQVEHFPNQPIHLRVAEGLRITLSVITQRTHGYDQTWTFEGGGTLTATVDALDQICDVETHQLSIQNNADGTMVVLGSFAPLL
jgi:hypothetical protein